MRYLLFILSVFLSSNISASYLSVSDSIRYVLFIYYGCENQTKRIIEYSIEDIASEKIFEYKPDTLGVCILPNDKNSLYFLRAPLVYMSIIIDKSKEIVTDTFTIPPIYKAPIQRGFYIGPTYYQYYKCGVPCNGYQKTYRDNGELWQKGHFKHGKLKSLRTFYPNGLIESKIKDRMLNGYDRTFDKSGKLQLKLNYFLFITHYKFYEKENRKYLSNYSFGRYK